MKAGRCFLIAFSFLSVCSPYFSLQTHKASRYFSVKGFSATTILIFHHGHLSDHVNLRDFFAADILDGMGYALNRILCALSPAFKAMSCLVFLVMLRGQLSTGRQFSNFSVPVSRIQVDMKHDMTLDACAWRNAGSNVLELVSLSCDSLCHQLYLQTLQLTAFPSSTTILSELQNLKQEKNFDLPALEDLQHYQFH